MEDFCIFKFHITSKFMNDGTYLQKFLALRLIFGEDFERFQEKNSKEGELSKILQILQGK